MKWNCNDNKDSDESEESEDIEDMNGRWLRKEARIRVRVLSSFDKGYRCQ